MKKAALCAAVFTLPWRDPGAGRECGGQRRCPHRRQAAGLIIEEPPEFVYPGELGFGVAIGLPYDMFYISGSYYLFRGNVWYRAPYYNGPWVVTRYKSLPPGLRRHKLARIHEYREREYRAFRGDREHYRGKYYRPDKHEMKERRKDEKREMKEERKKRKEKGRAERGEGARQARGLAAHSRRPTRIKRFWEKAGGVLAPPVFLCLFCLRQFYLRLFGLLIEEQGATEHLGHLCLTGRRQLLGDLEAIQQAAFQYLNLDEFVAGYGLGGLFHQCIVDLPLAHRDDRLEAVSQSPEKPFLFSVQHEALALFSG